MVGIAQLQHVHGNLVHQVVEAILDLVTIGPLMLQSAPLTVYRISRFLQQCRHCLEHLCGGRLPLLKLVEFPHIMEEHGTPLLLELTELHVLGPELRILGLELLCQAPHHRLCDLLRHHGTR